MLITNLISLLNILLEDLFNNGFCVSLSGFRCIKLQCFGESAIHDKLSKLCIQIITDRLTIELFHFNVLAKIQCECFKADITACQFR